MKFYSSFQIDNRAVGENAPVYIVAEAGVSHFGDEEKALRLVDLAVEAEADAVKFQVFDIDALFSVELSEWRERLGPRQLSYDAFCRIRSYCLDKGITFFATAHDEPSLEFLSGLHVPAFKVGSGEVGNWRFLRKVASLGKPLFFSTGMYRQDQISKALQVIEATGNKQVAVLHCVTRYPTPPDEVSLGNIALIHKKYGVITGYSDHTSGYHFPLAAAALGARIIEKHISLDFNVPNAQDWKVSCGPDDFRKFIRQVREIEAGLKARVNGPTSGEIDNLSWAGKSLVAARDISAGATIRSEDIATKRAGGGGIPPYCIDDVIGRKAKQHILRDKTINWEQLQ